MNLRLMDWYIGKTTFYAMLVVLLAGTLMMFVFALLDKLQDAATEGGFIAALAQAVRAMPRKIEELAPFAIFLGVLLGIGSLSSNSELTVLRGAGISIARLFFSVCIPSLIMIVLAQILVPLVLAQDERGHATQERGVSGAWVREGNLFTRIDSISNQNELQFIEQYRLESPTQIAAIRAAESATALDNTQGWQFENVTINSFQNDRVQVESLAQAIWNTPRSAEALTVAFTTEPRKMSLLELAEQIDDLKVAERDPKPYQVEFWSKLTKPLSVFGLVLIALGFVIGSTREMGMGARLTFGIGVGFAFHYFQTLVAPMTIVFALPPAVAISVPIMLVWVVGMLVVRRVA